MLFPAPFGPSRPNVSPVSTLKRNLIDRSEIAKPFTNPFDGDG